MLASSFSQREADSKFDNRGRIREILCSLFYLLLRIIMIVIQRIVKYLCFKLPPSNISTISIANTLQLIRHYL